MADLTQKQADVFFYIKEFIDNFGYPPTRVQVADEFNINPNAAQARIEGLVKKGAITRKKGVFRSTVPVKGFRVRVK